MTRARDISKIVTDANLSGTLDVTGNLTVGDGSTTTVSNINTGNSYGVLMYKKSGVEEWRVGLNGSDDFVFRNTDSKNFLNIADNGDISFYEDTGTTPKFRWDASDERLGLGTVSPISQLSVVGANSGFEVNGDSGSSNARLLAYDRNVSAYRQMDFNALAHTFQTSGTERMSITSTGIDVTGTLGVTGVSSFANGSNSAPSISFTSDTNTGIYRGGTDILKFVTAGTDAITINASQQVGIGTTPSAKLDVGGNILSIGMTVKASPLRLESLDTSVNLGESIGDIEFYSNDSSGGGTGIQAKISAVADNSFGTSYALNFLTGSGANPLQRMQIANTGDISFYEDTGTTAKFFWDASAERLGIGTSSPTQPLHVDATGSVTSALFDNNGSNGDVVRVGKNGTDILKIRAEGTADLALDASNGVFIFKEGGSEAMRIDGSGNLLVGGTNSTPHNLTSGGGFSVRGSINLLSVARQDNEAMILNRTGTDGDIALFRKDGSDVGSITTNGGTLEVGSGDVYLQFNGTNDWIKPVDGSGSNKPNVDLGTSGAKFKDLYLSSAARALEFVGVNDTDTGMQVNDTNIIKFRTANAERVRIDGSGNLTVGTTDINPYDNTGEAGVALRSTGAIYSAVDSGIPLIVNRMTSDGTIAQFRRAGVFVGAIGATSTDQFWIARNTGNQGIKFKNSALMSSQNNGADYDNAQDLGSSSVRWKDLYLSGGVYVGGTGSANLLNDYEEGNWDPTVDFSGASPTSGADTGYGRYTKIGDMVTVWATITNFSVTGASGTVQITGLPFAGKADATITLYMGGIRVSNVDIAEKYLTCEIRDGESYIRVMRNGDNTTASEITPTQLNHDVNDIFLTLTYKTT